MQYISTREKAVRRPSAAAIAKGLSDEGGLFVPEELPQISPEALEAMVDMPYEERAKKVLSLFLTDYTKGELNDCVMGAYGDGKFAHPEIAPVKKLCDNQYMLELWHGPTCAFKDMALQILPRLMTAAMKKLGETNEVVVLVATSGDTGKAALEGFKDVDGTRIVVFYPAQGVSDIQRLQMVTQRGDNVAVCAVNGNFDDAQNGVKAIFTDKDYGERLLAKNKVLSSANSINWGRLVPQVVYYVSAYCDMVKNKDIAMGDVVNVCVPTGNFGNILAAYYAKRMGVPIGRFICASNANNVLTDFLSTGEYNLNRAFYTTISPSMDILISSNLERLLFELFGRDDKMVVEKMEELKATGKYTLDAGTLSRLQAEFYGGFCGDTDTKEAIARIYRECGYLCDTHTAVGVQVHASYMEKTGDTTKTIIASTASPFKFGDSVAGAVLGDEVVEGLGPFELLREVAGLAGTDAPASLAELSDLRPRFRQVCEKKEMMEQLDMFLA